LCLERRHPENFHGKQSIASAQGKFPRQQCAKAIAVLQESPAAFYGGSDAVTPPQSRKLSVKHTYQDVHRISLVLFDLTLNVINNIHPIVGIQVGNPTLDSSWRLSVIPG